ASLADGVSVGGDAISEDGHGMLYGGGVVHLDRDFAWLRGETGLVELQGAARVGRELEGVGGSGRSRGLRLGLRRTRRRSRARLVLVVTAAACNRCEREQERAGYHQSLELTTQD